MDSQRIEVTQNAGLQQPESTPKKNLMHSEWAKNGCDSARDSEWCENTQKKGRNSAETTQNIVKISTRHNELGTGGKRSEIRFNTLTMDSRMDSKQQDSNIG
jgi:hypothetical protein